MGRQRLRDQFVKDPRLAYNLLSQAEQDVLRTKGFLTRASFVKAIDRALREDPEVGGILESLGGPNNPDFYLAQFGRDCGFEVTTNNESTVAAYPVREYVQLERLVTYEALPEGSTT